MSILLLRVRAERGRVQRCREDGLRGVRCACERSGARQQQVLLWQRRCRRGALFRRALALIRLVIEEEGVRRASCVESSDDVALAAVGALPGALGGEEGYSALLAPKGARPQRGPARQRRSRC